MFSSFIVLGRSQLKKKAPQRDNPTVAILWNSLCVDQLVLFAKQQT